VPDFGPIIREAYLEILEREPDPGGLDTYNRRMNAGLSEPELRELLLRSPEYRTRNPDPGLPDRLGLNVHIPSVAVVDDVATGLGLRWARLDFDWFRLEPARGSFAWDPLDQAVSRSAALGLRLLATLAYTPSWASSNPGNPRVSDPPAQTGFWTDFVAAAITRYRDRIRHWQFWNEPNITEFWSGGQVRYRTEILEPAVVVARSLDSRLEVVGPGLANLRDWRDWLREALRDPAVVDVVNHHNYGRDGREAIEDLERDQPGRPSLRTLMRELHVDGKPFWLTETGRRSSQGDQRAYYQEVVDVLEESAWVHRVFLFHYWDGPGQGNGGLGIVNEDLSPKPAYVFLRDILRPAARR
jgi:polysaccharide biosynthesis protein PslG